MTWETLCALGWTWGYRHPRTVVLEEAGNSIYRTAYSGIGRKMDCKFAVALNYIDSFLAEFLLSKFLGARIKIYKLRVEVNKCIFMTQWFINLWFGIGCSGGLSRWAPSLTSGVQSAKETSSSIGRRENPTPSNAKTQTVCGTSSFFERSSEVCFVQDVHDSWRKGHLPAMHFSFRVRLRDLGFGASIDRQKRVLYLKQEPNQHNSIAPPRDRAGTLLRWRHSDRLVRLVIQR